MIQYILLSLLVTTALATETRTAGACVFPFIYKGVSYDECTMKDDDYLWCATTSSYDVDGLYGYCVPEVTTTTTEAAPLPPCVFPFTYKNVEYNECITKDNWDVAWCATTSNYDEDKLYRDCLECVFPFIYNGTEHNNCITNGNAGKPWCATTGDYDRDMAWTPCDVPPGSVADTPAVATVVADSSDEYKCVFPFIYKNVTYHECTTEDNHGKEWCATTDNYDTDHAWIPCEVGQELVIYTKAGDKCQFPFYYRGGKYTECTTVDTYTNTPWCSLTTEYNRQYGDCDI